MDHRGDRAERSSLRGWQQFVELLQGRDLARERAAVRPNAAAEFWKWIDRPGFGKFTVQKELGNPVYKPILREPPR